MVVLRVAFIGAGQVNFGGGEGPWNHAKRIEVIVSISKESKNPISLEVVGIADPYVTYAQKVLENQRNVTKHPEMWQNTQLFESYLSMINTIPRIDGIFIGVPPASHGSVDAPNCVEMDCASRGIHMFIEKPISCYPLEQIEQISQVIQKAEKEKQLVVSVAYMFRYSKAVHKMKEIIDLLGPVRCLNARYSCAYSHISKEMWWDVQRCGGPIIEQATHFCDLARFLAGDVDESTLRATSIKQSSPLGKLSKLPPNVQNMEQSLPEERRVPRVTTSLWTFTSGAIGALTHTVLLHGKNYESELEVWGDGYHLILKDPYGDCSVSMRIGENEKEILKFSDDDVYFTEVKAFLDAIISKDASRILSKYEDASKTYSLTWKIRLEAEK